MCSKLLIVSHISAGSSLIEKGSSEERLGQISKLNTCDIGNSSRMKIFLQIFQNADFGSWNEKNIHIAVDNQEVTDTRLRNKNGELIDFYYKQPDYMDAFYKYKLLEDVQSP